MAEEPFSLNYGQMIKVHGLRSNNYFSQTLEHNSCLLRTMHTLFRTDRRNDEANRIIAEH